MRNIYVFCLVLVALLESHLLAADSSVVDPTCVKKMSVDGVTNWQVASNQISNIEILCHQRSEKRGPSNKGSEPTIDLQEWKISWESNNNRRIVELDHVSKNIYGIHVANDQYKFYVGKSEVGLVPNYKIGGAIKYNSIEDFSKLDNTEEDALLDVLGASYQILGFSLQNLLADKEPGLQLDVAKFLGSDTVGDRPIRLEWKCVAGTGPWKKPGTRLWAELDPKTSWLIARCGINVPGVKEFNQKVEYQPFGETFFQKTITKSFRYANSSSIDDVLKFEQPHLCTRSTDEFFLPYYDISESTVDITRTNPWIRMSAIVLSLIGVAVSIYFYRMSKRSTGPAATTR